MLYDLDDSGIMSEINKYFTFGSSQIIFNINKFVTVPRKKPKSKSIRARSNSKSPIRLKVEKSSFRSRSSDARKNSDNCHGTSSPSRGLVQETQNLELNQLDRDLNTVDVDSNNDNVYHAKKLSRHSSISDLNRALSIGHFTNMSSENPYFSDLSLNNSIIYHASSQSGTNGILFTPKNFDLNTSLFNRMFYNYVQACLKIRNLFENFKFIDSGLNKKSSSTFEIVEQGVLFNMLIDENNILKSGKGVDKSKLKELNFWVVGRRRLQRANSSLEWDNLGDFFVCFHDSLDNLLIEIAFDFGFSKSNV